MTMTGLQGQGAEVDQSMEGPATKPQEQAPPQFGFADALLTRLESRLFNRMRLYMDKEIEGQVVMLESNQRLMLSQLTSAIDRQMTGLHAR